VTFTSEEARMYALERYPCPWCGRLLRPCNQTRHITTQHFRQLTIDDELRRDRDLRHL
jgi:hypothetical protein